MSKVREIDEEKLKTICLVDQGAKRCRYIGVGGYVQCLKLTGVKQTLDERVEKGTIRARGDNCDGLT